MPTAVAETKQVDFKALHNNIQNERIAYYDFLNRLEAFGHRILDTNTPPKEPSGKEDKPYRSEGVLTDLALEYEAMQHLNVRARQIMEKLEQLF